MGETSAQRVNLADRVIVEQVGLRAGNVTGPNGSGKSTLLRCLYGMQPPTEGRIAVFGTQPDERSAEFRRTVSVLLDDLVPFGLVVQLARGPEVLIIGLLVANSGFEPSLKTVICLGIAAFGLAR